MSEETKELYDFGPFRLDASRRLVSRGQQALPLTSKTFDTLLALVRNHDRVLAKQELMDTLWPDSFVEEVNLAQNVSALRKALPLASSTRCIWIPTVGCGSRHREAG